MKCFVSVKIIDTYQTGYFIFLFLLQNQYQKKEGV